MPNDIIFLDGETYYDDEYSLRKMTPAEYILDPRFEEIMWAVKVNDGPHEIVEGSLGPWLSQFDPAKTTTVVFNALFDNSILAWHHAFVPHTMLCTMSMARTLLGHKLTRFNLAGIAEHFGLAAKGTAIHNVKGLHASEIKANGLWKDFREYAQHDNELSEQILWKLLPQMPASERRLMDMTLRCCIEPRFHVNTQLLNDHIVQVKEEKEKLIAAAGGIDKKDIMSTARFKTALENLGVLIEYKDSPTSKDEYGNPKQIPAFSKSDEFMETLQNDPDPAVAALATARIGLKSTLEETRSTRLWKIGNLPWSTLPNGMPRLYSGGTMPIPLRYGGAHTHRLSGDWGMNMQNMPTVRGSKGKSKLRLSLEAPPGHSVVTCDLGQIEARLVAWLCGEMTLLEEFAKKLDPYNKLASAVFGRPVNRKLVGTIDEIMGFIGKTGILGLGYGCGEENFDTMVIRSARAQAVDISQIYTRDIGNLAVKTYRTRYHRIPTGWRKLGAYIDSHWSKPGPWAINFGPVTIKYGEVMLPSGLSLMYDDPRAHQTQDDSGRWRTEFSYRYGKMRHRLYGAKLLENISQALARIIVMNAALRIRDRGRYTEAPHAFRFVLQAHDELVFIVPDNLLDLAKQIIHAEMTRPPSWGQDIPLTADVGVGKSYGEAK